ncbi:hypothetical protein D3C79_929060 [compost metagenome]
MPGGQCFDGDDQYPEPPVQPADGVAGPAADGLVGVGGERTGVGVRYGHFAEHAHDQHHQGSGHEVRNYGSGPGRRNGVPGTYEKSGTDNARDGQHRYMTWLETLCKVAIRSHGVH